jgi:LysM repeat protein
MASNKKSSIMLKTSNNTMIPVKIKTMASVGKEKKTSPETTNTKGKIHVVVNGDSLWKIAKKYKTSIEALKKANALTSDKLDKGQKILIK